MTAVWKKLIRVSCFKTRLTMQMIQDLTSLHRITSGMIYCDTLTATKKNTQHSTSFSTTNNEACHPGASQSPSDNVCVVLILTFWLYHLICWALKKPDVCPRHFSSRSHWVSQTVQQMQGKIDACRLSLSPCRMNEEDVCADTVHHPAHSSCPPKNLCFITSPW